MAKPSFVLAFDSRQAMATAAPHLCVLDKLTSLSPHNFSLFEPRYEPLPSFAFTLTCSQAYHVEYTTPQRSSPLAHITQLAAFPSTALPIPPSSAMQQKFHYAHPAAMFTSSHLAQPPLTSRYTHVPQQFSYNDISIRLRVLTLISQLTPNAHSDNLTMFVTYICATLTRMHRTDQLGPKGIQSTEDVFVGIGYDKTECYMGLVANAPGARAVMPLFAGDRMEISTKMEMASGAAIEELRNRFTAAINRKYEELRDVKMVQRRW